MRSVILGMDAIGHNRLAAIHPFQSTGRRIHQRSGHKQAEDQREKR
ncbi:hypothetical protein [Brevundimonas aveniformis]|nr:hypothetical protein [Brevundimonas aveniformis]